MDGTHNTQADARPEHTSTASPSQPREVPRAGPEVLVSQYNALTKRIGEIDNQAWQVPGVLLVVTGPVLYYCLTEAPDNFLKIGILAGTFVLALAFFSQFTRSRLYFDALRYDISCIEDVAGLHKTTSTHPTPNAGLFTKWSGFRVTKFALFLYMSVISAYAWKTGFDYFNLMTPTPRVIVSACTGMVWTLILLALADFGFRASGSTQSSSSIASSPEGGVLQSLPESTEK